MMANAVFQLSLGGNALVMLHGWPAFLAFAAFWTIFLLPLMLLVARGIR